MVINIIDTYSIVRVHGLFFPSSLELEINQKHLFFI